MEFEMFLKPLLPEQIRQMVNVQEKLISFDRQDSYLWRKTYAQQGPALLRKKNLTICFHKDQSLT